MKYYPKVERTYLEIERNLMLDGFVSSIPRLHADVTREVEINGRRGNYALLSQGTRFGIADLGYIDPITREFRIYDRLRPAQFESTEGGGGRKTGMYVPNSQLPSLQTIEEVLSISGISIKQ